MRSSWLASAVAEDGGLWFPGGPAGRAAALHLGVNGVVLAVGRETARLSWEDHSAPRHSADRRRGWWVTWFVGGRSQPMGIAVGVAGSAVAETAAVREVTRTWFARMHEWLQDGPVVLVREQRFTSQRVVHAERDTLRALCEALAAQPVLRSRLAEQHRARRLAAAMARRPLRARQERFGLRRPTLEALVALRSLGYRHPISGRPLPGEPRPDPDTVADRVLDLVRRTPYTRDAGLRRQAVSRLIRRHYLDVEAWPFSALTGPGAPGP